MPTLLEQIQRCRSGDELWQLAASDDVSEVFFSEAELTEDQLVAILDHARAWAAPDDISAALALACRATAIHPGRQLLDAEEVGEKAALAAVLDARIDELRAFVKSPHRPVRIAALHALGCCRHTTASDREVAARLAGDPDATIAATARLMLRAAPEPTTLIDALDHPQPLPVEWGWRWEDIAETTAHLAVKLLRHATIAPEARTPLALALARRAEIAGRSKVYLLSDVAMRIAFGETFTPPAMGLLLEDLDDAQRAAVSTLGEEDGPTIRQIGLHLPEDVAPFLAGATGVWKPLGPCRWHLLRIWREVLAGEMDEAEAAALLVSGLPADELVAALCGQRRVVLIASRGFEDDTRRARDVRMIRRIAEALVERGSDLLALVAERASHGRIDDMPAAIALLAALRARGEAPPAASERLITQGIAFLPAETITDLLAHLPAPTRRGLQVKVLEYLAGARSYETAVSLLRHAATSDVDLLLDASGVAERAATAARSKEPTAALDLLRLAHQAAVVYASWATSGGEGMQRMLDVNRLAKQIRAWGGRP